MKTIWKGVLRVDPLTVMFTQVIRMPGMSNLLHVAEQHGDIALWFDVDDQHPLVERKFQIFGTGTGPIGSHLRYCGTVLCAHGELVLHVYESVEDLSPPYLKEPTT